MTTFIGSKRLQRNKVPEVNRFHQKQKKGTIDVWWLFDDGGLKIFYSSNLYQSAASKLHYSKFICYFLFILHHRDCVHYTPFEFNFAH